MRKTLEHHTQQVGLWHRFTKALKRDKYLYLIITLPVTLLLAFRYYPIYGILIAFQNYKIGDSVLPAAEWVGLDHFIAFINNPYFVRLMRNTFLLGLYTIVFGFPLPILLALSLNEVRNGPFKRMVQTISYLPYFVSTVVIIGILKSLMDVQTGLINQLITFFGGKPIKFFLEASWFRTIYVGSGIWQTLGYNAIIYLAALSGVDPALYESATIDGASRMQKVTHIAMPSIMPTVMVLLILNVGGIFGGDVQKVLLIQNPATYETSDVIGTYVYRLGIERRSYSYSAAVGLFTNLISFVFLFTTNQLSKKFSENSLW